MTNQSANALAPAQDSSNFHDTRNWVSITTLQAIYAQMPKNMDTDTFCEWVRESVHYAGGYRAFARECGVNSGLVWRVCDGHDSATLRRALGIPKHPRRVRLSIGCTPETIARFDEMRGGMTRGEFMLCLLEWYEWDESELPY